ncbi:MULTISPECIES: FtsW/RodA/SpoVE family cell cycle protein [unclassified Enterococcus]|jgi:cell division protein FtsW|uniref:FtsW/RodA/SpoVE family cell cycle protein n=1 Tax=unclassified Enterococcus TaxID=2608891 RepID=UPI003D26F978
MKLKNKIDWQLLIPYLLLSIIGLLMVYSASSFRLITSDQRAEQLLIRQFVFILMSWLMIFLLQKVKLELVMRPLFAYGILSFGILSLFLTRISFFCRTINGAQRWVSILGIQFQPSEIVNVGLILYLAYYFRYRRGTLKELKKPLFLLGICCLLIFLQPKVAGVFLILVLALTMIATAESPFWLTLIFFGTLIGGVLITGGLVVYLGDHGWLPDFLGHTYDRIRLIGNPFEDLYGHGFQMAHSYYALFNGGLLGLGLGNSITKRGFLPVAETDFIFSVLVEELGLIAGILVLGILFFLILRLFRKAASASNQQIGLIFLGTGMLLLLQTSINIASIVGLIPMTGVPLPFISYGGSSYLILSFILGICLRFSNSEKEKSTKRLNTFVKRKISIQK